VKIIGICGKSGSGKSTVGGIINKKYSSYIDCDKVSRTVTQKDSPCLFELVSFFGDGILFEDGTLNRGALSSIVFGNDEKMKILNAVTHKYIIEEIDKMINEFSVSGEKFVFLDAPTLFESGLNKRCDIILSVIANESMLVERIVGRDKKTVDEAKKRLSSQFDEKFYRENSDYIIENNGTLNELSNKTEQFLNEIERLI
jgi:dephospho-CoA kinase